MSVSVEFDLSGFQTKCLRFAYLADRSLGPAVLAAAEDGVALAKSSHRYTDRTGKLTATAKATLRRTGSGGATAEMHWPQSYAAAVDGGTRPHTITAKKRGVLAFVASGGNAVFARSVRHPGTRAYGFAGDAHTKAERSLETRLVAALHAAADEAFR
jgi:hypothetical protein